MLLIFKIGLVWLFVSIMASLVTGYILQDQ